MTGPDHLPPDANTPPSEHANAPQREHANLPTSGDKGTNRQTTDAPTLLTCPKCHRAVGVQPAATAWCLPCGRPMRPIRPKGTP